ncbi:MAG: hypothetical protein JWQ30_1026 [Sediminibacterium sp.]|nr:hypothetical protein [Chitinophagaceae bacterium]MDB5210199.1 hypothetical protein [Sediminibacterium sp.]
MQPKLKLLLLVLLVPAVNIFSQNVTPGAVETTNNNSRAQAIYMELGGNGPFCSVNYDFRFTRSQKGLGMRLGLGYFRVFSGGIFSIPVSINHLAGKAPNYFESGIGFTYANYASNTDFIGNVSGSVLVPSIGYRYQPEISGFFGRIVVSPLVGLEKDGGYLFWAGIGFGYKF